MKYKMTIPASKSHPIKTVYFDTWGEKVTWVQECPETEWMNNKPLIRVLRWAKDNKAEVSVYDSEGVKSTLELTARELRRRG